MSADWMDWLEGISGGVSGVAKGLDAGLAPFKTWEGIRTSDLANDRTEIGNRDIGYTQDAREGADVPDYYGQKIGADMSGYRKKMATDERDIYGADQQLALAHYLSDPEGVFQQGLKETGWTPGTPEYRQWLAESMAQFDPSAAVTAYDKMGVPGIENRNLNEQAALQYIENYARQKDPDAHVVRNADGTVSIFSNGEETKLPGDVLVRTASMISAKTPYDAISQGIKDETNIQKANADILKAVQSGRITPAVAFKYAEEEGKRIAQAVQNTRLELQAAQKIDTTMMPEEDKAAHVARLQKLQSDLDRLKTAADENRRTTSQIVMRTRPGAGGGTRIPMNPITGMPMGGALTAPQFSERPSDRPPGALSAGASGAGAGPTIDPTQQGVSGGGPRPRYPTPQYGTPEPTPPMGMPQLGGLDLNQLIAFLQAYGGANA